MLDAELSGTRDDASQRLSASGVSVELITTLSPSPAAVAVHDDGDVAW
jgi:hypothetical protein